MRAATDARPTNERNIIRGSNEGKSFRVGLVIILGVIGAVPLILLTPPFQVPDEVQHFYRAYEVSRLHFRAEVQNGTAGGTLPVSLSQFVKASVYTADGINYPATPAPLARTLKLASMPLNGSSKQFISFAGSAFYSPLPYIPQALGISIGRVFGLGPLYLFYLGRLFNCLASLAIVISAVIAMPAVEELIVLVGLLPMSMILYASLSPDAAVISCALLFTALSISASMRGEWKTRELLIAAIAAAVFCSVKPVYLPLIFASLLPGGFRPGNIGQTIRSQAVLLVVALGVTGSWFLFARSSMTSPLSGAHPSAQMHLIVSHPMVFISALKNTLGLGTIINLYVQAVGEFGWLTVMFRPGIIYLLPLINFAVIWRLGTRTSVKRSPLHALWCLLLAASAFVLIFVAMYLMWAQVGMATITGVQGRYLIPILAIAGIAAIELTPCVRPCVPPPRTLLITGCMIAIEIIAIDATATHAFNLFQAV